MLLDLDGGVLESPDGGRTDLAGFVEAGLAMERPRRLSGDSPVYTREAAEQHVEGTFIARCELTENGDVTDCCVLKGLPYMNEAVLDALETWKYTPARFKGRPVRIL